jgi:hypothetical protein
MMTTGADPRGDRAADGTAGPRRDARAAGLIVAERAGGEVRLDLSGRLFEHCVGYFRTWMDGGRLGAALGHGEGYGG